MNQNLQTNRGFIQALSAGAQARRNNTTNSGTPVPRNLFTLSAGFTLIEMMVSVFIFSVVMVIATGALVSIIGANRKAQSVKTVMNNLNFAVDSMTRAIRVGKGYQCGDQDGGSCPTTGSNTFFFTDTRNRSVVYKLNTSTKRIERSVDGGTTYLTLTSPGVTINRLMFYVDGSGSENPSKQPRVLIIVGGTAGTDARTRTTFDLQTLVSQRIIDR